MARALIIYHWHPDLPMKATFRSHLRSLRTYSAHDCYYLNAARSSVPYHLRHLSFDLVVFHNTFLMRKVDPVEFARVTELVRFVKDTPATLAAITSDESFNSDQLVEFIEHLGVKHVFTFANPAAIEVIYLGVDRAKVTFHPVLSGYIDDDLVSKIARSAADQALRRPIDIGCRVTAWPSFGSHRQMYAKIAEAFRSRAPAAGFSIDVSDDAADTFFGDAWFDFLLRCRYTLGAETGSSVLDRDGSVMASVGEYVCTHQDPGFEEVRAACFPGLDGGLDYRALAPRHLDAVITRTCQVLVEGEYSGLLRPGDHYIELKRDFTNVDEVMEKMKDEDLRIRIVDRAYQDIVESGRYSYRTFADTVFGAMLGEARNVSQARHPVRLDLRLAWNRAGDELFLRRGRTRKRIRRAYRTTESLMRRGARLMGLLGPIRRARRWLTRA